MAGQTAIRATWADFKLVKTRQVAQLIFEVPLEGADAALATLGGVPQPSAETWVGIARITEEAATRDTTTADKPRKRMSELSRTQQAGILCGDVRFHAFISRTYEVAFPINEDSTIVAAEFVRQFCEVDSRRRLNVEEGGAGRKWDQLRTEYDGWRGAIGHPDERNSGQ